MYRNHQVYCSIMELASDGRWSPFQGPEGQGWRMELGGKWENPAQQRRTNLGFSKHSERFKLQWYLRLSGRHSGLSLALGRSLGTYRTDWKCQQNQPPHSPPPSCPEQGQQWASGAIPAPFILVGWPSPSPADGACWPPAVTCSSIHPLVASLPLLSPLPHSLNVFLRIISK